MANNTKDGSSCMNSFDSSKQRCMNCVAGNTCKIVTRAKVELLNAIAPMQETEENNYSSESNFLDIASELQSLTGMIKTMSEAIVSIQRLSTSLKDKITALEAVVLETPSNTAERVLNGFKGMVKEVDIPADKQTNEAEIALYNADQGSSETDQKTYEVKKGLFGKEKLVEVKGR